MSTIKTIRDRLGLTQTALAIGIGCSQGNISHYEIKGQNMPPDVAKRLIAFAASRGKTVSVEEIYGIPELDTARANHSQSATVAASGLQGHPGNHAPALVSSVADSQAAVRGAIHA